MNRILKTYLKRLTNLSTRNKSLLLSGLPSEQFLDIHEIDFLTGKSSFDVLGQLIQGKNRIPLCDVQDPRFERANLVSKRIRKIARTENLIREERGSRDLYVGYPFVRGKLADGTPIHAPFLFFPVSLGQEKEQWCLFERDDAEVILNRSFALAYSHFNEASVADEVLEKSFEDFSKDPLEFRTQLYEWIKETPFKINFNQALFENKLLPYDAKKSTELLVSERNGELKFFPEAVLGIFPQAGSYLVPDYNYLISEERNSLLSALFPEDEAYVAENVEFDTRETVKIKEENVLTPFSIDESQENIILSVKSGQSVVVQGPPGSGKSQLICNLISDFTANGKKVLLVCQKRAALDVVFQRLKTIGVEPFLALIHDFKNDRAELYRQFAEQIEKVESYRQQNYSLDSVFIERQFTQESRSIDRAVSDLDGFRSAFFDDQECGVSIKELYLTSDPDLDRVDLGDCYRSFRIDELDAYLRKLRMYAGYSSRINKRHLWFKRKSFSAFGLNDLKNIEKMLTDWPAAFARQIQEFASITDHAFSKELLQNRSEILERLNDIRELIVNDKTFNLFKEYLNSPQPAQERLAFIRQVSDSLEGFLLEDGLEMSLSYEELYSFRIQLQKVIGAKKTAISGLWWDLFGSEKKQIAGVAEKNGLGMTAEHLSKLDIKVRNRIELESWLKDPKLLFNNRYLDDSSDREVIYADFFHKAEYAADAAQRTKLANWSAIITDISDHSENSTVFIRKVGQLINWLEIWDKLESALSVYLLKEQIGKLVKEPTKFSQESLSSIRKDFDSVVDMDSLWESMASWEKLATERLFEKISSSEIPDPVFAPELFQNSIKLAWIGHIENKFPQLRVVSSLKMEQWEGQLQESISSKQKFSRDITAMKLREHTYRNVESNRLGNRITYRELYHQVTKKRKIWPIRKLLENYKEEVFSLVPCWMASPEAVSAIFPMEAGLFDLIIFDEASQCYAEYGLPAAFRGKQIVVTGDSKQLPPSDLYRVRFEEKANDEEYSAPLEIESLLDLAAQSLNQQQLSGHYRSLSLDLIDFSNQHFYKNTLRLLPDFHKINDAQPGIEYRKVDGIWKQNANLVEAEHVAKLIGELGPASESIGVVTFNFYQQQAIQDILERDNIIVKELFVKNIENVQGDERDIIIFSMGYAPDKKGKLGMNFGTLNMQGGENRLNVAITRARHKVYFVTSILPSQLETDNSANAGPKLLKAYMQYALEVSDGKYVPKPIPTDRFRSDWLLKDRLVKEDSRLRKELPFCDLTIKEEEVYKGVILTDDDLYFQAKSSKEPHAYLPLLLAQKNWPFRKNYSRQYWAKDIKL